MFLLMFVREASLIQMCWRPLLTNDPLIVLISQVLLCHVQLVVSFIRMVVVFSCALITVLGFVLEGSLFGGQLLLELGNHELVLTSPLLSLLLLLGLDPGFILFERGFKVFLG